MMVYQICTNHAILKDWFSRNNFIISGYKFREDIQKKSIPLHEAVAVESKFGGRGKSILAVMSALFKSNAKQRAVLALKPEHYTVVGDIEAVHTQTNNLRTRFSQLCSS